jgi:membrane fusion protein, multidrug efflux system
MLKTILASIALIAIVLGLGAAIGYQKYKMMTAPPPPNVEQPEVVIFAKPERVLIRQISTAVGTILSPRSVHLRTEVVGTVSEVSFKSGQVVDENQVLLKLDTSVEEAQLASAVAAEKIAESTFKRTKQAADAKALSELELEQASAMLAQAKSEVIRLNAVIRKKTLRAPFCARAGLFDIHPGQYLPEGTQVTMLQGIDDYVHIDFMMPQSVADEVHVGDEVRLVVEPAPLTATIIAIDSQSDRITRNLLARAKLENPPAVLQPNDSVRLELEFGKETEAFTIPASGLRRSPTGAFVYVVTPDEKDPAKNRVHIQPVIPGKTILQKVAIMHGLNASQTIVADGSFKLREGLWVIEASGASSSQASTTESSSP